MLDDLIGTRFSKSCKLKGKEKLQYSTVEIQLLPQSWEENVNSLDLILERKFSKMEKNQKCDCILHKLCFINFTGWAIYFFGSLYLSLQSHFFIAKSKQISNFRIRTILCYRLFISLLPIYVWKLCLKNPKKCAIHCHCIAMWSPSVSRWGTVYWEWFFYTYVFNVVIVQSVVDVFYIFVHSEIKNCPDKL